MLKKLREEKIEIAQDWRKRFLETHQNIITKLKQELASKAESEMRVTCYNYENKVDELKKEIQHLHDELYNARSVFVEISEENNSLQLKIDSMSQIIQREEIEIEIRLAYEKKLNKMKEQIQKEKTH